VIRLGDGTEKSHILMQEALDDLWRYTGEMFRPASYEAELLKTNYVIDLNTIQSQWHDKVGPIFEQAGLIIPKGEVMQYGGKEGRHTEYMGYILTELQYMQRTYPQMHW
jgi:ring-1,2-phenylacetyl-CoA epoxidase subunit PaaC